MLKNLPLSKEVIDLLKNYGTILHYKKGYLLQDCNRFDQGVCILISGIVKMSIKHNHKKILLYHLDCSNPIIMNYTNTPNISSDVICSTIIKDATILNIPNDLFLEWTSTYIELRDFMIASFQYHYMNIINKTQEIRNQSLEELLLSYIKTKSKLYKNSEIKIPLLEISEDLNFSREAISRGLRILENNKKIIRKTRSIVLLET
ncbi:hypothetical protein [uncultured Tenacibaculum sp.]|uniref:Crp/Fnr family transcriptional regulator n=1 Tax=uncultured Tenacibaculum sp. TaxID=174713 RepID=UPI00262D32DE|nr:hypothetical protein [uncultured Tenacibaculum sp.]